MTPAVALLVDGFGRVSTEVEAVLDGLPDDALTFQVDPEANTIAWLVWHLARVQDDHVAGALGQEQVWTVPWSGRFDLPFDPGDTGYGHAPDQVREVRVSVDLLLGYYRAVHAATERAVSHLSDADLASVIDDGADEPVTVAVRLVSVIGDDLQHVGQAAYVRGIRERMSRDP